jgi:hypothetical protein
MRQVPDKRLAKHGRQPSDIDGDIPDLEYRQRLEQLKLEAETYERKIRMMKKQTVSLHADQTAIRGGYSRRRDAVEAAFLVTLSPHEHVWTIEQQRAMAEYCLWAYQRLSAVRQCVDEEPLEHGDEVTAWSCGCGTNNALSAAVCRVCGRTEA